MNEQNNASYVYSVNMLRRLKTMGLINTEEYQKVILLSARHYEVEKIYV